MISEPCHCKAEQALFLQPLLIELLFQLLDSPDGLQLNLLNFIDICLVLFWALGAQSWMQCSGGDVMSAEEQKSSKSSHRSVYWLCSCGPGHSWPPLLSGHPAGSCSACRLPRAPVFLGTSPACIAARCKACFCTCWIS